MSQVLSLCVQQEVQLRFLCPQDLDEVKKLCAEWFPIEYPDTWYNDITSNPRFYSLAATYRSRIIGLIVAEIKPKSKLNKEDADILATYFPANAQVAYILSLGVVGDFRRNGIDYNSHYVRGGKWLSHCPRTTRSSTSIRRLDISTIENCSTCASLLLDSLLSFLTSKEGYDCKAVYLHVLATNSVALRFYEHRNFKPHSFLPYYYSIEGKPKDGFSYVLYINGGQPPWSIIDYISHCGQVLTKMQPCAFPRHMYHAVCSIIHRFLFGSSRQQNESHVS